MYLDPKHCFTIMMGDLEDEVHLAGVAHLAQVEAVLTHGLHHTDEISQNHKLII